MSKFNIHGLATKIAAGLGVMSIVVAAVGVMSFTSLDRLSESTEMAKHSYRVLDVLSDAREAMVNRETGLRGFLISGDEATLAPYTAGTAAFARALAEARQLTSDNPTLQQHLREVEAAAATWTRTVAERAIALARVPETRAQALEIEARGEGRASFDAFRRAVEQVVAIERRLLEERGAEYEAVSSTSRTVTIVGVVATLGLAAAFLVFLTLIVVRPIRRMTEAMSALADGKLETEIPGTANRDEIGAMAKAVQVFKENALAVRRMEEEAKAAASAAAAEKRASMHRLADQFEAAVGGVVEQLASAASGVQRQATSLSATAEQASRRVTAVSAATEQASANVQTVASATEELAASVGEISRQVGTSAAIASRAVAQARETDVKIQSLSQAANQIGDVVRLIGDIAGQTNLLALNATIEAARAGEAGKGFAVVASEVKNLAAQTAKATEEIGQKVGEMQSVTADSVTAIRLIGETITEMSAIASSIASAIEEQGAATQEIARNVQEAAKGTQDVSSNLGGVTEVAAETGHAAGNLLTAASAMTDQAALLKREVSGFLATVRAA
jgi:methyl-accepting chemotaxis protein